MTTIQKGKISNILDGGRVATVTPYFGGVVTPGLTVHFSIVGELSINTPVAYVLFEDGTGIILARMDGQGNYSGVGEVAASLDDIIATQEDYIAGGDA